MKMKNKILGVIIVAGVFAISCKKILEQKPFTALDAATAFTTKQSAEAGVLGVYSALQNAYYYGLRYWALADLYSDVLVQTGTFPSFAQYANRSVLPDNVENTNMWNTIYNGINRANNVIAAIPNIGDPSFTNKNALLGEARFLRALMYFDLIRMWGGSENGYNQSGGKGVPLFVTPTLTPEDAAPKPRATEQEVYTQIVSDLDFAIANLPATNRNGRVNTDAANALKARMELYRGNNAQAETLATQVITKYASATTYGGLATDYASLWLLQNQKPESIFELQFDPTDANSIAFFYFPTTLGGRNEIASSTLLDSAHERSDKRLPVNFSKASSTPPIVADNKTLKYTRVNGIDNVIIIRLAELYLIRAEARAKIGTNLIGAKADVDLIRARAGLAPTTAVTQADLLTAIEKENYIEFAHEGQRYFNLRRNNREDAVLGLTGANAYKALLPIPQREVLTGGKDANGLYIIQQNTGY